MYAIDLESIICNLVINSIEAFKKVSIKDREIIITITVDDSHITINYKDNGPGISSYFLNPYDIFKLGVTDKRDPISGEVIGTGLGMYIIAVTIAEYNGEILLSEQKNGFELDITIPIERE